MPIGVPKVPYRLPGSQYEQWISIYSRLSVERILFLGQEVTDGLANALVAQMLYLDWKIPLNPSISISTRRGVPLPPVWPSTTPCSTSKRKW